MTKNEKGKLAEANAIKALTKKGFDISIPLYPCRYDFIIDDGQNLNKVQCKYGSSNRSEGCICFSVASTPPYGDRERKTYVNDIDYFVIWSDKTDEVYMVPIEEVKNLNCEASLRIKEAGISNPNIRYADDFKI